MTFRTGKRHKVQESGRSKSITKLASRLQYFINTGKVSKRDLKAIDDQVSSMMLEQTRKSLQLLEQLKDQTPMLKGKESLEETCNSWRAFVAALSSKKALGYSDVRFESDETRSAILDSAIEADTDLFRMLTAFGSSLAGSVTKASYEVPNAGEIRKAALEILEAYETRKKIMAKLRD